MKPKPTLAQLLWLFAYVGGTSFGGGLTAYLRRVVVDQKGWLENEDFIHGLSMAQLIPGVNALNLSVWLGWRLKGWLGALLSPIAMVLPPGLMVLGMGLVYFQRGDLPAADAVLKGIGAAAVGLTAALAVQVKTKSRRPYVSALLIAATFYLVAILKAHIFTAIGILTPISIFLHRPKKP